MLYIINEDVNRMLRKTFLLFIILLIYSFPVNAAKNEIINNFAEFANVIVNPIQKSYLGNHYTINLAYRDIRAGRNKTMYYKTENINFNYAYDVQKSETLISPYIGIIEMYNDKRIYKQFLTEEQARNEKNDLLRTIHNYKYYEFYYHYIDNEWRLYEIIENKANLKRKLSVDNNLPKGNAELKLMACDDTTIFN